MTANRQVIIIIIIGYEGFLLLFIFSAGCHAAYRQNDERKLQQLQFHTYIILWYKKYGNRPVSAGQPISFWFLSFNPSKLLNYIFKSSFIVYTKVYNNCSAVLPNPLCWVHVGGKTRRYNSRYNAITPIIVKNIICRYINPKKRSGTENLRPRA